VTIVEIDEKGKMTVPKKLGLRKTRAVVIPAGSFFVTIPLTASPQKEVERWLHTDKEREELKDAAEKLARQDAVKRAKRRKQICFKHKCCMPMSFYKNRKLHFGKRT
jgi:bifunctional DNA-binding transcriptional regulator/antitoxin component of YhaV-PrlF toxin-antitoxin module